MEKTVYRSKVDLWLGAVLAISLVLIWYTSIGMSWAYVTFCCGGITMLYFGLIFGFRYVIEGDTLVIYQFFSSVRVPVSDIKSIRKTTGYLATAGMSRIRVSITLVYPNSLKSRGPIEISPKDRDKFIAQLVSINPEIEVL
ncbi:MAG: PH domain-containing protein [Duncaniella sp.]|nr:PH domain-containing protein [Duncaniella sp.]